MKVRKRVLVISIIAVFCAVGIGAAAWFVNDSAEADSGTCLNQPLGAKVASGQSPKGENWYIEGQLENNAKCRFRLLRVTFKPFGGGGDVVSWSGAYSLPIGGSLPNTFVISSEQVRENGAIVYGGITSGKAAEVEVKTRSGKWVSIETRAPQIATPPIWLRNLRYFIEYLPGDEKVERIRVRDKAGGILYQGAESVLGIFQELGAL